jgi:hypothetical protein
MIFPPNHKPDLVLLPFKVSVHDTGQPLTLAQAQAMLASGQAEFVRIERSHPGAPEALGWTFFERTRMAYVHTGDPLFAAEREARRHLRTAYAVRYEMNADDCLTPIHLNF